MLLTQSSAATKDGEALPFVVTSRAGRFVTEEFAGFKMISTLISSREGKLIESAKTGEVQGNDRKGRAA